VLQCVARKKCRMKSSVLMRSCARRLPLARTISGVLQCVAVCCSVLQCVAVCCSVVQCVAARCSLLQCVVLEVWCVAVWCGAVCCSQDLIISWTDNCSFVQ